MTLSQVYRLFRPVAAVLAVCILGAAATRQVRSELLSHQQANGTWPDGVRVIQVGADPVPVSA